MGVCAFSIARVQHNRPELDHSHARARLTPSVSCDPVFLSELYVVRGYRSAMSVVSQPESPYPLRLLRSDGRASSHMADYSPDRNSFDTITPDNHNSCKTSLSHSFDHDSVLADLGHSISTRPSCDHHGPLAGPAEPVDPAPNSEAELPTARPTPGQRWAYKGLPYLINTKLRKPSLVIEVPQRPPSAYIPHQTPTPPRSSNASPTFALSPLPTPPPTPPGPPSRLSFPSLSRPTPSNSRPQSNTLSVMLEGSVSVTRNVSKASVLSRARSSGGSSTRWSRMKEVEWPMPPHRTAEEPGTPLPESGVVITSESDEQDLVSDGVTFATVATGVGLDHSAAPTPRRRHFDSPASRTPTTLAHRVAQAAQTSHPLFGNSPLPATPVISPSTPRSRPPLPPRSSRLGPQPSSLAAESLKLSSLVATHRIQGSVEWPQQSVLSPPIKSPLVPPLEETRDSSVRSHSTRNSRRTLEIRIDLPRARRRSSSRSRGSAKALSFPRTVSAPPPPLPPVRPALHPNESSSSRFVEMMSPARSPLVQDLSALPLWPRVPLVSNATSEPLKMYEVYEGASAFLFGGRLITGPLSLMRVSSRAVSEEDGMETPDGYHRSPAASRVQLSIPWRPAIAVAGHLVFGILFLTTATTAEAVFFAYFWLLTLVSLARVALTDPGVVPRGLDRAATTAGEGGDAGSGSAGHVAVDERWKMVMAEGEVVRLRWCMVCEAQGYGVRHCEECECCVAEWAGHYPWLSQCGLTPPFLKLH